MVNRSSPGTIVEYAGHCEITTFLTKPPIYMTPPTLSVGGLPSRPDSSRNPFRFYRRRRLLVPILALALPFLSAFATDYYVDSVAGNDSNDGKSTTTPWQTLTKVNGIFFAGGDNVLFKRGSSWTGTLYPKIDSSNVLAGSGTSSTNRVVFDAYGTGPAPIINGGGATWAVQIVNKQYFTFQNFNITNDAAADGHRMGIRVAFGGAGTPLNGVYQFRDVRILNNEIHHVRGTTVRAAGVYDDSGGIYVQMMDYLGAQTQVDGLLIEGNDLHDNRCIGLEVKAPSNYNGREDLWATNLVIRNNIFDQGGADHIVVNGAKGALIEGNAGYDAGILESPNAGSYIAGMWTAYHTRDVVFQFNEVARTRNSSLNGVSGDSQAFDADLGTLGYHTFQYNYTHDNEGGVLIMMPDSTRSKTVIYRYNISVNDGRKTNTGCQFAMHPYVGVSAAYVYNNVFYSTRPEGFKFRDYAAAYYYNNIFHLAAAIYPSNPVFSNNCYFGHTPDVTDPYKILADPKFVGPLPSGAGLDGYTAAVTSPFKLQSTSPCINQGKSISPPISNGGGRDFWNNPLTAGAIDIGAHEVPAGANAAPLPVTFIDNPPGAAVTYGGTWTHGADNLYYNSTKSTSTALGSYCQCAFTGTNISIFGTKGPDQGKLSVNIDGAAPVVVDCYWPVPLFRVQLYQISGLTNAAHTVKATVASRNPAASSNALNLDYFLQTPGTPPSDLLATSADAAPGTTVVYNGAWSHVSSDAKYYATTNSSSATVGSYVDLTFIGNGVRLFGTRGAACGKLSFTVDGGPATVVNCYQGVINDYQVKLFETKGLTSGTHTLRATVATKDPASSGNTIALDCFQTLSANVGLVDLILDNTDATGVSITGSWIASVAVTGYYGSNAIHDNNDKSSVKSVRYTPGLPLTSSYEVFARWPALSNRSNNVPIDINYAGGAVRKYVNQQINGGQWMSLGIFPFNAGSSGSIVISNASTSGYVFADAIRFVQQPSAEVIVNNTDATGVTITGAWNASTSVAGYYGVDCLTDGNTAKDNKTVRFTPNLPVSGNYEVYAWWTAFSNRATNVPIDITSTTGTSTVFVNQQTNGSQWVLLGTYSFNAGTGGNALIKAAYLNGSTTVYTNGYVMADAIRFLKQ